MPLDSTAPTGEIFKYFLAGKDSRLTPTGTLLGATYVARVPWTSGNTNTANPAWINPETGTVLAKAFFIVSGVAGTGTFDMGRSSDGTGTNAGMVAAGTLAVGVTHQVTTGTVLAGLVGETNKGWWLIGPGATGTNNSIVCRVVDTTASTMTGAYLLVTYMKVE